MFKNISFCFVGKIITYSANNLIIILTPTRFKVILDRLKSFK